MDEINELKNRIEKIEERNARVESDKKWEQSWLRKVSVGVLTYIVICIFLFAINVPNVYFSALVPVLGFILSTVSLRIIRKISIKK